MQKKNNTKLLIIGIVILAVLALAFFGIWTMTRPETNDGDKTITVIVDFGNGTSNTHEINTDAEFLREALDQIDLVQGEEGEFGLYILTVDGVTADESAQQWWCLTKNGGETVMSGVETTPIADGEQFEITLKTGW